MKKGDIVIMNNNYYVNSTDKNRPWTVASNPYIVCGTEVVLLEGYNGCYATDGLSVIESVEI